MTIFTLVGQNADSAIQEQIMDKANNIGDNSHSYLLFFSFDSSFFLKEPN